MQRLSYKAKEDPKLDQPYYENQIWPQQFAVTRRPGAKGMNTLDPAQDIDPQEAVGLLNTIISNGLVEPRPGSSLLLAKPTGETGIPLNLIECRASDGTNFLIGIYGVNFYLYDPGAVAGTNSQWIKINGSVTPTQNNLVYGFANWNNGYGDDRTYMCNGRDHMYKFIQNLNYASLPIAPADTTITVTDASRFPASGTLIVQAFGGSPTSIPYSSKAGNVFTLAGPAGITVAAGAAVTTNLVDVSGTYIGKVLFTWQRRLVLLNRYGVETGVYYSDTGDPEGFAAGGVDGGGAFQVSDGDGALVSGQDFGDYAVIGKPNSWSQFDFQINDALNAKLVRLQPFIAGQSSGPVIHQGCVKILNKLYYPTPTEGMLRITPTQTGQSSSVEMEILSARINNLWTQAFSIVNARSKYFANKVFTAVGVPEIGYNDTPQNKAVNNSLIAVYDVIRDGYTLWNNLPVSDFAIHNSLMYYLSNSDGSVNQLMAYGIYDDAGNPYNVVIEGRENDFGDSGMVKTDGHVFIEGFIERNTDLYVDVLMDHRGVLSKQTYLIEGDASYVQFGQVSPLGSAQLGIYALGSAGIDFETLGVFRVYLEVASRYGFYTIQTVYRTEVAGSRFQITGEGYDPQPQNQIPLERVLSPQT